MAAALRLVRSAIQRPSFCQRLGSDAGGGSRIGVGAVAVVPLSWHWGPSCQSVRAVARVRINRFTGVRAVKQGAPKTDWQIAAEKEFLAMRKQVPKDEYTWHFSEDDLRKLTPEMQKCLMLRCGSSGDISRWRKHQLIRKFQRKPFDTNSPAVRIAVLTERILRIRAHLIKNPKRWGHRMAKQALVNKLTKRQKAMKTLYRHDFTLYRHVCTELGIRCIRFAVPVTRDPMRMINPQAVDGDRARFLIRQRMYHAKFRPREMRDPQTNKLIRYTRHPMEPVPASHGKPLPTAQQISRSWPYGVRSERVQGKHIIYNPTAAGQGYWPARLKGIGGPTPE